MRGNDDALSVSKVSASAFAVSNFFINRHDPPRSNDLARVDDSVRANAAIAQIAGVCAATDPRHDRYMRSERERHRLNSVDAAAVSTWIASHLSSDEDAVPGLPDEVAAILTVTGDREGDIHSVASMLIMSLMRDGLVSRAQGSTCANPTFALTRSGSAPTTHSRSGFEAHSAALDARTCALMIVRALSDGIDANIVDETAFVHKQACDLAQTDVDLMGMIDKMSSDSEANAIDVADFVEAWITPEATKIASQTEIARDRGETPSRRAVAFARLDRLAPRSLLERRRMLFERRAWVDGNWEHNARAFRAQAGDDDTAFDARSQIVIGARNRVSATSADDRVVALYMVSAVEHSLLSIMTRSPMYGKAPLSCARNMGTWLRRQDAHGRKAREAFVSDAKKCLQARGSGALAEASVRGHLTGSRRAAVAFGEPMSRRSVHGGAASTVACSALRETDAADLFACTVDVRGEGDEVHAVIVLTAGLLATAFANVVQWSSSTRAKPVYAVWREASRREGVVEGWAPTDLREIAEVYVECAAVALDGLYGTDRVSNEWKNRFGASTFTASVGTSPTYAVDAVAVALSSRRFLAGHGDREGDKLQELDPTRPLPLATATDLLARGIVEYGREGVPRATPLPTPPSLVSPSAIDVSSQDETTGNRPDRPWRRRHARVVESHSTGLRRWGDATPAIPLDSIAKCRRSADETEVVLSVPSDPRLTITMADLRMMGLIGTEAGDARTARPRRADYAVVVGRAGDDGRRRWVVPTVLDGREGRSDSDLVASGPSPGDVLSHELAYILEVHTLLAVPWPGADTIAACSATALGPSGELWEDAIVVVRSGNRRMDGPHARAQIARLCPHIAKTPFRSAERDPHRLAQNPPALRAPVVRNAANGAQDESLVALCIAINTIEKGKLSNGDPSADGTSSMFVDSGENSSDDERTDSEHRIPSLERGTRGRRVVGHVYERGKYRYTMSDGGTETLPANGWGETRKRSATAVDDALKSEVRRYWRDVRVFSADEFLRDVQPRRGRMTPHDAPKRSIRPSAYVASWNATSPRIGLTEIALTRAHALMAWDRSAALVQEREECFVYALPNTVTPEFPLIVVAGLCVAPYLPLSIHHLIARAWARRDRTCPHFECDDVDFDVGPIAPINAVEEGAERFEQWMRRLAEE